MRTNPAQDVPALKQTGDQFNREEQVFRGQSALETADPDRINRITGFRYRCPLHVRTRSGKPNIRAGNKFPYSMGDGYSRIDMSARAAGCHHNAICLILRIHLEVDPGSSGFIFWKYSAPHPSSCPKRACSFLRSSQRAWAVR